MTPPRTPIGVAGLARALYLRGLPVSTGLPSSSRQVFQDSRGRVLADMPHRPFWERVGTSDEYDLVVAADVLHSRMRREVPGRRTSPGR